MGKSKYSLQLTKYYQIQNGLFDQCTKWSWHQCGWTVSAQVLEGKILGCHFSNSSSKRQKSKRKGHYHYWWQHWFRLPCGRRVCSTWSRFSHFSLQKSQPRP